MVERRTAVAASSLAGGMVLAAGAALTLASLGWRMASTRSDLRARLGVLPVAARRGLAGLDLVAGRPRAARARLAATTRLAPFSAVLWLERGEAALQAGDPVGARRAAIAARRRAPVDAAVCERAALLLLQAGGTEQAASALRCVVSRVPRRAGEVYDLAYAVYGDDAFVVRAIAPPDGDGVRGFLGWAYARGDAGAAAAGWEALAARGPATGDIVGYVDFLLERGDVAAADARWTAAFGARAAGIVVDGGFEGDAVNGGFGWRVGRTDGARVQVQGGEAAAEGRRGLAIEFTGGNVDFAQVSQVVPVAGGRRYRLTALARSAGLTSLSGPRLQVEPHRACPGLATVGSQEIRGTTSWTPVRLEFTTPPDCGAVTVRVRRVPSTRLDRDLRGRLWLDDVRLAEVADRS